MSWARRVGEALRADGGGGLARIVLALVAGSAIAQFVYAAFRRVAYPFELEWMEGGIVDHVRRVLDARPLYVEPGPDFTPYIYTPLYYEVSALVARLVGIGFFAPRLVSLASVAGTLVLLWRAVRREGGEPLSALVAIAFFLATFEVSGFWMDIARVDSLFTFLVVLAAYLARCARSVGVAAAIGGVLCLSFFTKQTGLTLALPVLLGLAVRSVRLGIVAAAVFGALTLAVVVGYDHTTHGWFSYYVFKVPAQHQMRWNLWRGVFVDSLWTPFAMPLVLTGIALFIRRREDTRDDRGSRWLAGGLVAATFASAFSSILHADGWVNALIPFYAVTSLTAGLGLQWVLDVDQASPEPARPAIHRLQVLFLAALVAQFLVLLYDHRRVIPGRRDVAAAERVIAKLRATPGPVLMLGTGYYGAMAGHPEITAHTMALADVYKTRDDPRKSILTQRFVQVVQSKRYPAIVLDRSWELLPPALREEVRRNYRLEGHLFDAASDASAAWPRTGYANRPDELWVRLP